MNACYTIWLTTYSVKIRNKITTKRIPRGGKYYREEILAFSHPKNFSS